MLRALAPYLVVAFAVTISAGVAYGTALIGVPPVYLAILAAAVIVLFGYDRWDRTDHKSRYSSHA